MNQDFWVSDVNSDEPESDKAQRIADLVMPLLENLANKDNDADTIKWPATQRIAETQAVIDKIKSLLKE